MGLQVRTLVRRGLLGLLALVLLVVGWYGASRVRAGLRAVSIERVASVSVEARQASSTLRLATYNIAHARGPVLGTSNWHGGTRSEQLQRSRRIGETLARLDLDLVVLNEVDFSCTWSHRIDEAMTIAEAAGFPYLVRQANYDLSLPFFRVWSGNVVLSRLPISQARLQRFPTYSRLEALLTGNHDSVVVTVCPPGGPSFSLWAVHLEFRSEQTRVAAAEVMLEQAARSGGPLVIAGDLNSTPRGFPRYTPVRSAGSAVDRLLARGLFRSFPCSDAVLTEGFPCNEPRSKTFSFPSERPDRSIDWILVPTSWWLTSGAVLPEVLSDHRLVHVIVDTSPGNVGY